MGPSQYRPDQPRVRRVDGDDHDGAENAGKAASHALRATQQLQITPPKPSTKKKPSRPPGIAPEFGDVEYGQQDADGEGDSDHGLDDGSQEVRDEVESRPDREISAPDAAEVTHRLEIALRPTGALAEAPS